MLSFLVLMNEDIGAGKEKKRDMKVWVVGLKPKNYENYSIVCQTLLANSFQPDMRFGGGNVSTSLRLDS